MPLITPQVVAADGALVWQLFSPVLAANVTDTASMYAFISTKLEVADAWMRRRLGGNYDLTDPDARVMQAQAQSYLTLFYLVPILQAAKVYAINYPIWSELAEAYDALVQRDFKEEAISLIDEWVTVEQLGPSAFARPVMIITSPVPILASDTNGRFPAEAVYEEELAQARGLVNADQGTVRR
jgi:hypothetical protein